MEDFKWCSSDAWVIPFYKGLHNGFLLPSAQKQLRRFGYYVELKDIKMEETKEITKKEYFLIRDNPTRENYDKLTEKYFETLPKRP